MSPDCAARSQIRSCSPRLRNWIKRGRRTIWGVVRLRQRRRADAWMKSKLALSKLAAVNGVCSAHGRSRQRSPPNSRRSSRPCPRKRAPSRCECFPRRMGTTSASAAIGARVKLTPLTALTFSSSPENFMKAFRRPGASRAYGVRRWMKPTTRSTPWASVTELDFERDHYKAARAASDPTISSAVCSATRKS